MPNLCFCILCDLRVTKCLTVGLVHEMSTHYFSYSGGPSAVSIKLHRISYVELVLLHPVGSMGDVVHSRAFGA
jgi:hypothetical protein